MARKRKPVKKSAKKPATKPRRTSAAKPASKPRSKQPAKSKGQAKRSAPLAGRKTRAELALRKIIEKQRAELKAARRLLEVERKRAKLEGDLAQKAYRKQLRAERRLSERREQTISYGKRPSRLLKGKEVFVQLKKKDFEKHPRLIKKYPKIAARFGFETALPGLPPEKEIRKALAAAPAPKEVKLTTRRKHKQVVFEQRTIRRIARRVGVAAPERAKEVKARVFLTGKDLFQAANQTRAKYRERPDADGRFVPIKGGRSVSARELRARMKQAYYWAGVRAMAKNTGWSLDRIRNIIRSKKYEGNWRKLAEDLQLFKQSPGKRKGKR